MTNVNHAQASSTLPRCLGAFLIVCALFGEPHTAHAQTGPTPPFGNALSLNGTNQYVSVPNGIWFSNQFTVEAWVYVRSYGSWARLMEFGNGPGNNNILCAFSEGTTGQPIFQFYDGSQSLIGMVTAASALPMNAWRHLAFTYDGTNGTIFTNGFPAASGAMSAPPAVLRTSNYIGRSLYTADAYANVIFDEFRLWSTARSPAQIQMNLGQPLTGSEANLILYYRFDETGGTVATNSAIATGASDNGTLVNGPVNVASTAPSTLVLVTNDSGPLSLRGVISNAPAGLPITFATNLSGSTILLTNGMLALNQNITIDASALPGGITINGNQQNRVFEMATNVTVVLNSLTITNGLAADYGGGIYNLGNLTVNNCTLAGNSSEIAGGAIRNTGVLTLNDSTLSGNLSGLGGNIGYGGGIASAGTLTVSQSTLAGNTAGIGGGIYIPSIGTATLNQSTLSANSGGTGSGIDVVGGLSMTNSIVAGNAGSPNIFGSFAGASNLTNGNPLLAPLGNYGGPTQTMPPLAGSPAIDAAASSTFTTDQRGYPRPLGAGPDIGAVEVDWPASDLFGNALSFNGNQYVTVTNFGAIAPTNEVTVEFWAYATAVAAGNFVLNPDGYPTNRFFAAVNYPDGNTYWEFGNIGAGGYVSAASPPSSISNWVHYTLVASQSGNYMRIYTNGILCANTTGMTPFVPGNYALQIGAGFIGLMDEFRVWTNALSEAQILAGINTPLTGNEPGLLLYYAFDSAGGSVALNSATVTGAVYNGTTVNGPAWEIATEPSTVAGTSNSLAYTFTTLAGSSSAGSSDGIGGDARFANPVGVAVDANGNVYVGDTENNTIRKITPAGVVTTLAGVPGSSGSTDGTIGTNGTARFFHPSGVALDRFGNLFVADFGNGVIREITTNGVASTLVSCASQYVAVDNAGNIYAVSGFSIVKFSLAGQTWVPTTLAGNPNVLGDSDGPASTALFNYPYGLAVDAFYNVYVCDELPGIREITSNGMVLTLAGSTNAGTRDGIGTNAQFYSPFGISIDSSSNIFVGDGHDDLVRRLTPVGTNWQVTTYAGVANTIASVDGTGTNAKFGFPFGVAEDISGNLYVVDQHFNNIRKITSAGVVTTLAGPQNSSAYLDGTGLEARFNGPSSVTVDSSGNIYVADTQNEVIRKITSAGVVSTLAGKPSVFGEMNGNGNQALFGLPAGIVADSGGNLYVTDNYYGVIRKVTPAGAVSTIAGSVQGYHDGPGASALFNQPAGIAMDQSSNLYVAEQAYNTIRMLTPVGTNWMVSTVAGYPELDAHGDFTNGYTSTGFNAPNPTHIGGYADGTGAIARFNEPTGIAVDSAGNLYVADTVNSCIRKLVPPTVGSKTNAANWAVTTLAGVAGMNGDSDGAGANALFGFNFYNPGPTGIAVDGSGNLFVTDDGNNTIRRITPAGVVSTIAGLPLPDPFAMDFGGSADGTGDGAQFNLPFGIAADSYGALYVADLDNNAIRKGVFASYAPANPVPFTPPSLTGQLTVTLLPPEANGQWRLATEIAWRNSGTTATGLAQGEYTVEFRSIPGYLAIPLSGPVAVTNGGTTFLTNQYYSTFIPDTNGGGGSLTVNIGPSPPAGAGWRFLGDTGSYYPPGYGTNLAGGNYLIQFAPVAGFVTPASLSIEVDAGFSAVLSVTYLLAASPPANVLLPVPVPPANIGDLADYPYGFNGQLQTDVGYGSGVAVQTNVVLTAAHLVFNDQTLSFVNQANWLYQEEAGVFSPAPLEARGWYVLSGYAAQRSNDVFGGLGPDQSSPQSRNMDVAALYFQSPVANGGDGGYLPSDASPNTWLTSAAEKMLVGYPVDGSQFGIPTITNGVMYETGPRTSALSLATDPVADQQVYTASWFLSYPGNSGGPLYVEYDGYYYPAAVYLGSLFNGVVPYASAVRAIDSNVVNLITLAAALGDSGTNNSGGGVITIIPSLSTSAKNPGYLILQLGPPSAVQAGAAWKLTNQPNTYFSTANPSLQAITSTNALVLLFKPIPGWNLPTNRSVSVTPGLILTNLANYTVTNPMLSMDLIHGLGLSGTTNTTYEIQSNSTLTGTWRPIKTNTLNSPGINVITNHPGPGFYRAHWLGN